MELELRSYVSVYITTRTSDQPQARYLDQKLVIQTKVCHFIQNVSKHTLFTPLPKPQLSFRINLTGLRRGKVWLRRCIWLAGCAISSKKNVFVVACTRRLCISLLYHTKEYDSKSNTINVPQLATNKNLPMIVLN